MFQNYGSPQAYNIVSFITNDLLVHIGTQHGVFIIRRF